MAKEFMKLATEALKEKLPDGYGFILIVTPPPAPKAVGVSVMFSSSFPPDGVKGILSRLGTPQGE